MRPSAFAAALRRKILALPAFTPKPVCGACGHETDPGNFGREFCLPCESERAAMSEMWEAERWAEVNGHPTPAPEFPIFGSDEAAGAFLPDDEDGAPAAAAGSPEGCICFTSDFEEWDRWTAPGLELPPRSHLLRVWPAVEPGGVSTVQVGCDGNVYGPPVPLTPAIWHAILAGMRQNSDKAGGASLYAIGPVEAAHWLDYVEDEPAPPPA